MFAPTSSKIENLLSKENDNDLQPASKAQFSSQELLEISQNISCYYAPVLRINRQNLMLLPIDPQHLFISWSLGDDYANVNSQSKIEQELILKIQTKSTQKSKKKSVTTEYEIPISYPQSSKKITIPISNNSKIISASIGNYDLSNNFACITKSNPVIVLANNAKEDLNKVTFDEQKQVTLENFNDPNENVATTVTLIDKNCSEYWSKTNTNCSINNNSGKGKKQNSINE